eukprot:TRINITY_DN12762_c0_g1_i2.p1 TRINITY_DN12762_c0_g1~~TRINITY_DN12762_c0_g1_i2.p1  ORF type:complete len:113 (+),score=12.09 TRINITY_DN12762_c0_g1_i2:101-439(+)
MALLHKGFELIKQLKFQTSVYHVYLLELYIEYQMEKLRRQEQLNKIFDQWVVMLKIFGTQNSPSFSKIYTRLIHIFTYEEQFLLRNYFREINSTIQERQTILQFYIDKVSIE